jgi:hypothetical protein
MLTATLAFALLGGFSPGANATLPNLHTDYAQARSVASADNKPIAVFIGRGTDAMGRMLADGSIPADAAQLLRDRYVALYIDTDTAAGKELAGRFALTGGLVISGPGGGVQAFRHSGTLSGSALTKQLSQYATAGQPTTTVGATVAPGSSGVVIPASGQYVVPQYNVAPQYAFPAGGYAYPSFGGFGPTCAPGRH